jgi:hypothetical protein
MLDIVALIDLSASVEMMSKCDFELRHPPYGTPYGAYGTCGSAIYRTLHRFPGKSINSDYQLTRPGLPRIGSAANTTREPHLCNCCRNSSLSEQTDQVTHPSAALSSYTCNFHSCFVL